MSLSIIILSNGNIKDTLSLVEDFQKEMISTDEIMIADTSGIIESKNVTVVSNKTSDTNILNLIIPKAKNEFVLIFDSYCFFKEGFLDDFRKNISNKTVTMARVDQYTDKNKPVMLDKRIGLSQQPRLCRMYCMAFPKNIAMEVGLFDGRFKSNREYQYGIEFCERMMEYGGLTINYLPKIKIYCKFPKENIKSIKEYETIKASPRKVFNALPDLEPATIFIPDKQNKEIISYIEKNRDKNDQVIVFSLPRENIKDVIETAIKKARHEKIIMFSPVSNLTDDTIIDRMKEQSNYGKIIVYDPKMTEYVHRELNINNGICFHKSDFRHLEKSFNSYLPYLKNLINLFENIQVIGETSDSEKTRRALMKQTIKKAKEHKKRTREAEKKAKHVEQIHPKIKKIKGSKENTKKLRGIDPLILSGSSPIENRKLSIIIPYMHNGDRWYLFEKCINEIHKNIKDDPDFELCIHETSNERFIKDSFIKKYSIKYMFTKWTEVFHRAWAINVGARYLASGDGLIFSDGDLILTKEWFREIKKINYPCVAWRVLYNLNKPGTDRYFKNGVIEGPYERTRTPVLFGAAGGVGYCPTDIFYEVQGIPEMFRGTWGGEDNAFFAKLINFGYKFSIMDAKIYHMYHTHQTKKVQSLRRLWMDVSGWNISHWTKYNMNNPWGIVDNKKPKDLYIKEKKMLKKLNGIANSIPAFNKNIFKRYSKAEKPYVTLAMLSFRRPDSLITALKAHLESKVPLNLVLQVQGALELSPEKIREITSLVHKFHGYDLSFTDKNNGTGVPRHEILKIAKEKFDTPYIMTTDDDMFFPENTFPTMASLMEVQKELGCLSMWCTPRYESWTIQGDRLLPRPVKGPLDTSPDAMGSATCMFRRKVFDTCEYDSGYYIGWADFDLCMQMKKNGWKLAILGHKDFVAENRVKNNPKEYTEVRSNRQHNLNSKARFKSKWGINIG